MRLRDQATNAQNMPRDTRSEVSKGTSESGPSLAEIRRRAFEIHIERGGIHGCDLDDWMQAERELQEKYNKSSGG
jgi:Protein of unknown function (DUF2934)